MTPKSMLFETDLTEPRNCVFKAENERSALTCILISLESKLVPEEKF